MGRKGKRGVEYDLKRGAQEEGKKPSDLGMDRRVVGAKRRSWNGPFNRKSTETKVAWEHWRDRLTKRHKGKGSRGNDAKGFAGKGGRGNLKNPQRQAEVPRKKTSTGKGCAGGEEKTRRPTGVRGVIRLEEKLNGLGKTFVK